MKQINFGYSSVDYGNGYQEKIGINDNLPIPYANYYGSFEDELGNEYIVAKNDLIPNNSLENNFIVRDAFFDSLADGSGILYLDQEQSEIADRLQKLLNNEDNMDDFKNYEDIKNFLGRVLKISDSNNVFKMYEDRSIELVATAIKHNDFESKKDLCKEYANCSFSSLRKMLYEAQRELQQYKEENKTL